MLETFTSRAVATVFWLSLLVVLSCCLQAAPPNLTAPGVIATIDRSDSYNLGATGLRGWIWVDRGNVGDSGLMTDQSRQILVTTASSPASAVIQADDVILGAIAADTGSVPYFTGDCRKAFGAAIGDAEKTGAGTLRVKRWRDNTATDVNIPLPILGNYSATAPYTCPKSSLVLANARNQMVGELLDDPNYLVNDYAGAIHGLALLAGVAPGDPDHAAVQTRLQTYARARATEGPLNRSIPIWDWSYSLLFLSEYYLLTGDSQVVAGINDFTVTLAESQSSYGTYGHSPSAIRPDGTGRRVSIGYGPVNSVGVIANVALVVGKKALQAANQGIDPEIDAAILRGSNFFAYYVNKGSIPYGEHEPYSMNHASNGKDPAAAVFYGLQANRAVETEYYTRMSIAAWIGREYGHTGQGFSYLWHALGANMGGPNAAAEHLKQIRWHLDLSRRSDGSFTYDGQEQYGGGTTSDGTYLGRSDHYGLNPTAIYLLTYSLPLQRIYLTGKNDPNITDYSLDSTRIAHAISAGSFRLDRTSMGIPQVTAALGDYDPVVRNYAAIEIAARSLSGTQLTDLRNLLGNPDPNLRQSACHALGLRQDAAVLPTIVGMLNDPDLWVRSKAATAIRSYTSTTISTHRDAMIYAFIANASDPDIINWNDPIQISNGKLSLALFGNGVPDGSPGNDIRSYTLNAAKETLLYPALRVGLSQPDSYPRTGVAKFGRQLLPLGDVQALYPEVVKVASFDTPADRMWSGDCRGEAIRLLGQLKITEGIPLALAMLEVPENFGWGSGAYLIDALDALASYGDAARYTLPTLKGYLSTWDPATSEYSTLVGTINALESSVAAPARNPGLCVANSSVVTTTGTRTITLTGASPRGAFSYINVTQPAHGTITGTAPILTYTPTPGYTGPDNFTFQTTDTLTTSTVANIGIVVGTSGNGLKAEYFNNIDFTSPIQPRIDSAVNFDWGTGSPDASIGADTFSVRWSGLLLVPETGNYTFSALTSDGARVYINGALLIDNFINQSTRWTDSPSMALTKGQLVDIYIEYFENTGSAVAKLKWTGPDFAGANGDIIPQAYLFDGSGIANRQAYAFPQSITTNRNTAVPITLNGSGGTLGFTVITQPTRGTLTGTKPDLTYTPNSNFSGSDSFTFLVNNGSNDSAPATISINVQAGPLTQLTWATATSGNWSDAARWTPGAPSAAGEGFYALNFTPAGSYTATHDLNAGFQLNQLNFSSNVTLVGTQSFALVANGAAQPQLNQNGDSTVNINLPMDFSGTTTFGGTGSGPVNITHTLSGSGGLVKNSPNTLSIYSASNTFSGGTVINNGTLFLDAEANSALGHGPVTLNGGRLYLFRIDAANPITLNGGTLYSENGFGNNWNGPVTATGNATIQCIYRLSIHGSISGNGGFTKTGEADLTLSAPNSHTGTTNVAEGTLTCTHASALGSGPLVIATPGKLTMNYSGTRGIESLRLNGAPMLPGTYGSTASSATNKNDAFFSGTGTITVLPPAVYTVNLDKQGGNGGMNSVQATVGSPMPAATMPIRTGYLFDGYFAQISGGGTQYYTAAMASATNWNIPAHTTLFAKWTANPYTLWTMGTFANTFTDTDSSSNHDGDSLTNLLEFAFDTDPTSSVLVPLSYVSGGNVSTPGIPVLEENGAGYHAVFVRRKNFQAAGLTYFALFSADFITWTASAVGLEVKTGAGSAGTMEVVSVPFPATVPLQNSGSAEPRFFRVGVSGN